MSCTLHYGPGAQRQVQIEALTWGPYMGGPFGLNGLKIDESRQVAAICRLRPPGDQTQRSVVIGPMDSVRDASSDALLKTVEEYVPGRVRPFLWAMDLGEVKETMVSRVIPIWSPSSEGPEPVTELTEAGKQVIRACLNNDLAAVVMLVQENKKQERALLVEAARALSPYLIQGPDLSLDVWLSIREYLCLDLVSQAQCVHALWPTPLSS